VLAEEPHDRGVPARCSWLAHAVPTSMIAPSRAGRNRGPGMVVTRGMNLQVGANPVRHLHGGVEVGGVAIRRILDHPDLSPLEKPPLDVREVVGVPVVDEGREITADPA
jgi:hypothetical protein